MRDPREKQALMKWERPTVKQLNYAHNLAEDLRIENNYNWNEMTREEISELIDEFKDRLGYK